MHATRFANPGISPSPARPIGADAPTTPALFATDTGCQCGAAVYNPAAAAEQRRFARYSELPAILTILSEMEQKTVRAPFHPNPAGLLRRILIQIGGSAESLGRHVTSSVVKSIFVVIVLDGLFAMFYVAIGF